MPSLYLILACLFSFVALHAFEGSPRCVECGGKNAHRKGCPRR